MLTQASVSSKEDKKNKNIQKGLSEANEDLPTLKIEKTSNGFWIDLLTGDDNKMPVERLQNLIFTFVYVVIYVSFFFTPSILAPSKEEGFNYIEFQDLAFVLMGISSGSYLIGKGMNR